MTETYTEFIARVKKLGVRKHKITGSYGVYDAYKYYRKRKPDNKKYVLTESQYFAIIRNIHTKLIADFLKGIDIYFPCLMGQIEVRQHSIEPKLSDTGKLVYNAPIDWSKTLKLWYEQPEAYKNKILIKQENREYYSIIYSKKNAKYKNQSYICFKPSRSLKLGLKQAINSGQLQGSKLLYKNGN